MRGDDEADLRVLLYKMQQFDLILFPGTPGHDDGAVSTEFADMRYRLESFGDGDHPVEACIAADAYIAGNTDRTQQPDRFFVLYKEMPEGLQHPAPQGSYGLKKGWPFRNMPDTSSAGMPWLPDLIEVIEPVFVFHPKNQRWIYNIQEASGVRGRIHRQVKT